VDSGSEDQTRTIAAEYGAKVIRIDPESFTFGYSLNQGIAQAQGEFVVLISAHCYPANREWLREMIAPFEEERVALVYGRQRGNGDSKFSEQQVFAKWFPEESNHRQRLPFCNNANAAIRRSLWSDIKYDESLTGLEDLDWARRATERGYLLAYNAEAKTIHVHQETWSQVLNRYRREAIAFARIFPEENFSFFEFVKLILLNVCSDYIHALRQRVFIRNVTSILLFRVCQFWGTYLGYRVPTSLSPQLRMRFYYPNRLKLKHLPGSDSRVGGFRRSIERGDLP
jgi:glycosyltransferase involved in cell wall biosynthesis